MKPLESVNCLNCIKYFVNSVGPYFLGRRSILWSDSQMSL